MSLQCLKNGSITRFQKILRLYFIERFERTFDESSFLRPQLPDPTPISPVGRGRAREAAPLSDLNRFMSFASRYFYVFTHFYQK